MVKANARERGGTLLMVTFISTFLLIPIIGTCIDGAVLYWVKARLSAAADSTALSTARALNVGQTLAAQECNAMPLGGQYFTANFPTGVMGTSVVGGPTLGQSCSDSRLVIAEQILHTRTVTVNV